MVTRNEIIESLHRLAKEGMPGLRQILEDRTPQNAKRPCWLTEYVTTTRAPASKHLVRVTQYFTISIMAERDARGGSSTRQLLDLQERALDLFLPGYLRVGDRALSVTAFTGGREEDRAYIDLQLEYLDYRTPPETHPLMEEIHTAVNTNKK